MDTKTLYTCNRCLYTTSRKSNYETHMSRKTPCTNSSRNTSLHNCDLCNASYPTLHGLVVHRSKCVSMHPLTCPICNIQFASKQSKSKHIRTVNCLERNLIPVTTTPKKVRASIEPKPQPAQFNREPLPCVQQQNVQNIQHAETVYNHHGNVTNITINSLGQENIDYVLSKTNLQLYVNGLINKRMEGICDFMIQKHFNPEHPENHNIRKLRIKDDFIECHDGKLWKPRFYQDALRDVMDNICKDYEAFVLQVFDEGGKINHESLNNFMKDIGEPLNMDFTGSAYDWDYDMTDEEMQIRKQRLYKLACEYMYRHSKKLDVSGGFPPQPSTEVEPPAAPF